MEFLVPIRKNNDPANREVRGVRDNEGILLAVGPGKLDAIHKTLEFIAGSTEYRRLIFVLQKSLESLEDSCFHARQIRLHLGDFSGCKQFHRAHPPERLVSGLKVP